MGFDRKWEPKHPRSMNIRVFKGGSIVVPGVMMKVWEFGVPKLETRN